MEKLRHQGKEWARVKQQKTQLTRQPQRSAPVLGATGEARAEVGRSPSLGRKPHGPPHPALLLPSPLRIGMATETLESPTQPLLCGQDGGDLITQLSSQTETVSWAQPWRPQPWGHCLEPPAALEVPESEVEINTVSQTCSVIFCPRGGPEAFLCQADPKWEAVAIQGQGTVSWWEALLPLLPGPSTALAWGPSPSG